MYILANNTKKLLRSDSLTTDLFPSFILEPKKILENIEWFLNPIEKPPQKFLQLLSKNSTDKSTGNIYSELLEKEGYIIKNTTDGELFLSQNSDSEGIYQESSFNIIFTLANDKIFDNFESLCPIIHNLLRPSSYFIYEMKVEENLDFIERILLESFESVNFLTPWSQLSTNPFSPFDKNQSKYCWIVALSQGSDEDPAEWMNFL